MISLNFTRQMEPGEAALFNPLQLAYLGDAVWETIVRSELVQKKLNVHHLHQQSVERVNAGAQARFLSRIVDQLTEEEIDIVKRGRNAHPRHAAPRNQQPDDYNASTGFEALIGYLSLTGNNERIRILTEMIFTQETR